MSFKNAWDTLRPDYDGGASRYPWATEEQYSVLPSPATTLIAITTYDNTLSAYTAVAVHREDKIRVLFETPGSGMTHRTSMLMVIGDEIYAIPSRETALTWFGYFERTADGSLVDADGTEYVLEVAL